MGVVFLCALICRWLCCNVIRVMGLMGLGEQHASLGIGYMWHLSDMDGPFKMVAAARLILRDATLQLIYFQDVLSIFCVK